MCVKYLDASSEYIPEFKGEGRDGYRGLRSKLVVNLRHGRCMKPASKKGLVDVGGEGGD